jgi:hypothetical protein
MPLELLDMIEPWVEDDVEIGKGSERNTPYYGLVAEASSHASFGNGGTKDGLGDRIHGSEIRLVSGTLLQRVVQRRE